LETPLIFRLEKGEKLETLRTPLIFWLEKGEKFETLETMLFSAGVNEDQLVQETVFFPARNVAKDCITEAD
jgi:hypothetical protein